MSKRTIYLVPLSVFLVMAVYFAIGLTKDPKIIPSALIDKPVPEFSLPPIDNGTPQGYGKGFSSADLKGNGVSVINVFASWCLPCRTEHPFITRLAKMKVARVYGLNYKDNPKNALKWLRELGDPYDAIGSDRRGRVGIDWGVYGVPETFIVDNDGRIRLKHVGPLSAKLLEEKILPVIRKLSR
ncbi:MAG: DsbE family thiol:disulfide interchange protein [Rhodospirillaceae bacterium]|jgi:cytochrome c biogenesis protein CcmG/thiol:disulfide interchange protein DsbE|nr:DsbE family thiol:disulfide interchange protein [Rhodospirillaceae bacterium]|tara:strand:- start:155 stop:706 length:552 start_codon:yes stop_codon:yes gene_type:complete